MKNRNINPEKFIGSANALQPVTLKRQQQIERWQKLLDSIPASTRNAIADYLAGPSKTLSRVRQIKNIRHTFDITLAQANAAWTAYQIYRLRKGTA